MKKNTQQEDVNADLIACQLEEREERLDTIRVCEEFLADAVSAEGTNLAAFFPSHMQKAARTQIEFERDALARLPLVS